MEGGLKERLRSSRHTKPEAATRGRKVASRPRAPGPERSKAADIAPYKKVSLVERKLSHSKSRNREEKKENTEEMQEEQEEEQKEEEMKGVAIIGKTLERGEEGEASVNKNSEATKPCSVEDIRNEQRPSMGLVSKGKEKNKKRRSRWR